MITRPPWHQAAILKVTIEGDEGAVSTAGEEEAVHATQNVSARTYAGQSIGLLSDWNEQMMLE
jgi:hypothetical protein